jgi:flagellar hook protein FlgE
MLTSLYTAISGMNANGTSLSVISDNIANMNTVGFKKSVVSFADILSQTLSGVSGTYQVGRGVIVNNVIGIFTSGQIESTTNSLDLAIDGDGFFLLNDNGARVYSRAGNFSVNKDGYIINANGAFLQGYLADVYGNVTGEIGNLKITSNLIPAVPTTEANIIVNLNSQDPIQTSPFTLDKNGDSINNDPGNYNSSLSLTVYDSQGGEHLITIYFVKTAPNTWDANFVYEDPANPGQLILAGTNVLTFNTDGTLANDNSATTISFNFGTSVSSPQTIIFNFGTGTSEGGDGLNGTTQYASSFSISNIIQNGYASGYLINVSIDSTGNLNGIFSNGQTKILGKVALARFNNPAGLEKLGRNMFAQSSESGNAIISTPATSGLGRILSNALELSNVDLAEEFVKMITAQRGFQANSRVVTTTDELMQELVNLKR